ncbi:MAG: 23S rRNA (uracil(1939)-C(5))-methyltransferase RlmD, partial [Pedobacter sp.]
LTIDNDIYVTLFVWIAGIFNTLFFLAGVPHDMEQLDGDLTYPKALKVFTQYVLIPLATVYVVILLAYEVKIALEWSLPKGLVSNLVLGYAVFGILSILLVFPIRNHEENKWLKTYARSFYILLMPLLVLLYLAMMARVLPYGITEQRYFLLVLAGWLTFITAYFLLSRKQNIKVIPISLCIVTLLAIYGPLSALSVSRYSQRSILIKIFEKYGKYKDGKLLPLGKAKLSADDGREALEKVEYLGDNDKMQALQGYVNADLAAVSDSLRAQVKDKRYRYDYELNAKQTDWLKKYLGLDRFSDFKYAANQNYNFGIENGLDFFDVREQKGFLRTLMMRQNSKGEWMVLFQLYREEKANRAKLFDYLLEQFPQIKTLVYAINPKQNDSIYDLNVNIYFGEGFLMEEMDGLKFKIGPKSFFQTNYKQALELYRKTLEFADLKGDEIVYDLYTGTGTIAQYVARNAKHVIGIESVQEAIDAAIEHAELNGLTNTTFYCGDMKNVFNDEFMENHPKADVLITDPPRDGMHQKVVEQILKLAPEKVVYVSCNSATQARDLALMKDHYTLVKILPVDMFPQTHHV